MSAYFIGNFTVHDVGRYMQYVGAVRKVMPKFGGTMLVADYEHQPKEGTPNQMVVVVSFTSVESAEEWYHSREYQDIIHLRKESCTGWLTLCRGVNNTGDRS